MTENAKKIDEAAELVPLEPGKPPLLARLRDKDRWRKSVTQTTVWFVFGLLLTTLLGLFSPGHPIIVGSNSIPTGVYWLDTQATGYKVGDYASFPFKPTQDWLRARYGTDRVFTKMIKGVAGDTVYADAQLHLKICHPEPGMSPCETVGVPQAVDSLGRPMTPWVAANHSYTLKQGEVWVYGSNPRSLDSRYYGPVSTAILQGKASPLLLWPW